MKIACTHFQCAAWALHQVKDLFPQPKGSDMSHDLLLFFLNVFLVSKVLGVKYFCAHSVCVLSIHASFKQNFIETKAGEGERYKMLAWDKLVFVPRHAVYISHALFALGFSHMLLFFMEIQLWLCSNLLNLSFNNWNN